VSGIERGTECARYEPLLSALADGEASADQLAILRPHMRTCLSCRARLREFRAAPDRVASVLPPAALVAADGGGTLRNLFESVVGAAQHKAAAFGERTHAAVELATGQKVAAVAASAAALAGGGTAVENFSDDAARVPSVKRVEAKPVTEEATAEQALPPAVDAEPVAPDPAPAPEQQPAPAPPPAAPPQPPDPATEFAPAGSVTSAPATMATPARAAGAGFAPEGGGGGSGGSGEFVP
jgi:anti-sigma factor RsiW